MVFGCLRFLGVEWWWVMGSCNWNPRTKPIGVGGIKSTSWGEDRYNCVENKEENLRQKPSLRRVFEVGWGGLVFDGNA